MATFVNGPATVTFNGMNLGGWITTSVAREMEELPDVDPNRVRPAQGDALSSCPFKPGSDEWKQWQQDYLAINPSTRTSAPDEFDQAMDDRELGRMLAASRLPIERVTYLNQQMREAREAIDLCGPDRKPFAPHGIFYEWTIDTSAFTAAVRSLTASMQQLITIGPWAWSGQAWEPVYGPPRPSRATRRTAAAHHHGTKRRRPREPDSVPCRHGNPSNFCRDCSMGRR